MKIVHKFLFLALCLLPISTLAQATVFGKNQSGNKTLIKIPVVVSDREGRRLTGLKKENFTVYQNDVEQSISSFATEDEPISIALLIDTSGSTQDVLNKIRDAAKDFIDQLNPKDQCLIATFDSKVNILTQFTSDREGLKKSLDKIQTAEREGTLLFNAIDQISQNSFGNSENRKAIVILSDGKDFGSSISRKQLIGNLEESDITIYPIFYQSGSGFSKPVLTSTGTVEESSDKKSKKIKKVKPPKRKNVYTVSFPVAGDTYTPEEVKLIDKTATTDAIKSLQELSDITAGRLYLSDNEKLSQIFRQVAGELRQQYLIGFYSDGNNNNIRVKVDRRDAVVQARTKLRS